MVFIGDSFCAWDWIEFGSKLGLLLKNTVLTGDGLQPWRDSMIQRWMLDVKYGPVDDKTELESLAALTGNWHSVIHKLIGLSRSQSTDWKSLIGTLKHDLIHDSSWFDKLDIPDKALPVLRTMAEYKNALTRDEIQEITEISLAGELIDKTLYWTALMQYGRRTENGQWILNPFVAAQIEKQVG